MKKGRRLNLNLRTGFPFAILEIKTVGQFLSGLVDGVFDFHRVDLLNNVE
jgi:hypothetical protein